MRIAVPLLVACVVLIKVAKESDCERRGKASSSTLLSSTQCVSEDRSEAGGDRPLASRGGAGATLRTLTLLGGGLTPLAVS